MKKHFLQFHPKLRDFLRISIIAAFALIIVGVFQIKAKAYFVCDIHSPTWVTTKPATCTQPGTRKQVCQRCGEVLKTETISATGHSYRWEVSGQTCTEAGVRIGTCTKCGGRKEVENDVPLGHSYSAWSTVTPATCTATGKKQRTCTRCNKVETGTIPATGHKWKWEEHKPTCTEDGVRIGTCTKCGETKTIALGDALGHSYSAWTTVTPATCTSIGKEQRTCTRCNIVDTRTISATGHSYRWEVSGQTCTEAGVRIGTCTTCGERKTIDNDVPLGHSYSDWTTVRRATCTSIGKEQRTCTRCNIVDTRIIPATGHKWKWEEHEPTCTEAGVRIGTCTKCTETKKIALGDALGHRFDSDGICSRCGVYSYDAFLGYSSKMMHLLDRVTVDPNNMHAEMNSDGYLTSIEIPEYFDNVEAETIYFYGSFMPFGPKQCIVRPGYALGFNGVRTLYVVTPGSAAEYIYWDVAEVEFEIVIRDAQGSPDENGNNVDIKIMVKREHRFCYNQQTKRLYLALAKQTITPDIAIGFSSGDMKFTYLEGNWGTGSTTGEVLVNGGMAVIAAHQGNFTGAITSAFSALKALVGAEGSTVYKEDSENTILYTGPRGNGDVGVVDVALRAKGTQLLMGINDYVQWNIHVQKDSSGAKVADALLVACTIEAESRR